jgi:hypothetical protein
LSEESRNKLLGQLKGLIDEMRRIPAPDGRISNVDGGSLYDCRLSSRSTDSVLLGIPTNSMASYAIA